MNNIKDKIINLIEEDINNTENALEIGAFLNPLKEMREEFVSLENKRRAEYIIEYLRNYLIPKIKELNEENN